MDQWGWWTTLRDIINLLTWGPVPTNVSPGILGENGKLQLLMPSVTKTLGCKEGIFHIHIANHFTFKVTLILIGLNLNSELRFFTIELSSGKNEFDVKKEPSIKKKKKKEPSIVTKNKRWNRLLNCHPHELWYCSPHRGISIKYGKFHKWNQISLHNPRTSENNLIFCTFSIFFNN